MKRIIAIEVNCNDATCGYCVKSELYPNRAKCRQFNELRERRNSKYLRLPACIAAEQCAKDIRPQFLVDPTPVTVEDLEL